jgi:hypothetical protein
MTTKTLEQIVGDDHKATQGDVKAWHRYLREALHLPDGAPYRFDYYAHIIEQSRIQPAERPNGAPECVACEGSPSGDNVPCAVCGAAPTQSTQQHEDFDTWAQNPYTKVLQKSIAEDYVPRAQQPDAGEPSEVDSVIACLGDDAATLREENPGCEIADNMDRAAVLLADRDSDATRLHAEKMALLDKYVFNAAPVPAPQVAQTAEGEPVADAARLRALLGRARAWMETSVDKPNMLCHLIDGALSRSAPPHSPIADSGDAKVRRDTLLAVLVVLNSNPYSLTKAECVDVVRGMFDKADAALAAQPKADSGVGG